MAPEQWTGAPASPSTDVYAATATLVECLTGHKPYPADSIAALRLAHLNAPPPTGDVPAPIRSLVSSGMAKDPERRPADARQFVATLQAAAVEGYGPGWEQRGRRELARLAVLALALLPAVGAAADGLVSSALTLLGGRRVVPWVAGFAAAVLVGIGAAAAMTGHGGRTTAVPDTTVGATAVADPGPSHVRPATGPGRHRHGRHRGGGGPIGSPSITDPVPPPPVSASVPHPPPAPSDTGPPASTPSAPTSVSFVKLALTPDAGTPSTGDAYLALTASNTAPITVELLFSDGAVSTHAESGSTSYVITEQHAFVDCASGTWVVAAKSVPTASDQGEEASTSC